MLLLRKRCFWCICKLLCIYLFFPLFLALKSLLVISLLVLSFNPESFSVQMFCQKFQNIEDILRIKVRGDIFGTFSTVLKLDAPARIFTCA